MKLRQFKITKIREVTILLLKRCQKHYPTDSHNYKLAEEAITNQFLPIDKISRWLGFLQADLIHKGIMTVDGERDFSRPLFHEAYNIEEKEFMKYLKESK